MSNMLWRVQGYGKRIPFNKVQIGDYFLIDDAELCLKIGEAQDLNYEKVNTYYFNSDKMIFVQEDEFVTLPDIAIYFDPK
jgi:hypothetical protein